MFQNIKKPLLIAELSANHNGSIKNAKALIDVAKKNGADAVKLQTYEPSSMTINKNFKFLKIKDGLWKGKKLWDLYKQASTPFSWQKELFNHAKEKKIFCFSSVFDRDGVDLLESLKCPLYKIASFEITDLPLIKYVAQTNKPIIISTGMSDLKEIDEAYNTAYKNGSKKITLLYCSSNYPSTKEDFNLKNIVFLKKRYGCTVGLSDHSNNNNIAVAAVSLGAQLFEKHIALKGQKKGPDIEFSLKGNEISKYKNDIIEAYEITSNNKFVLKKKQMTYKKFRRSLYIVKDIKKGDVINHKNIKPLRPHTGVEPKKFFILNNKISKLNLKSGNPLTNKIYRKLIKN